ncbi:MAG TPA: type II toxin-antitoxin system HicA family toxin [Chloroflexota bacterium]
MSRLPALTGAAVVRALQRAGFEVIRQRGSHVFLRHPDGRATVVPMQRGETLGPGLLHRIARDVELTPSELLARLRR